MSSLYSNVEMHVDVAPEDRLPGLPLVGFLIGSGLSISLWALIGILIWAALR